jgi:hypothetical protein
MRGFKQVWHWGDAWSTISVCSLQHIFFCKTLKSVVCKQLCYLLDVRSYKRTEKWSTQQTYWRHCVGWSTQQLHRNIDTNVSNHSLSNQNTKSQPISLLQRSEVWQTYHYYFCYFILVQNYVKFNGHKLKDTNLIHKVALQKSFSKSRMMGRNYGSEARIKQFHHKLERNKLCTKQK